MADQEKKKNAAAARAAARMRVLRAKQAASRMAQQELLAKLMFVEEEKKILQNELNAKLSCQQESLAQAAHLPPQGSPPNLCVSSHRREASRMFAAPPSAPGTDARRATSWSSTRRCRRHRSCRRTK